MASSLSSAVTYMWSLSLHLIIGAAVVGALYCVSRAVFDPLRKIPGPFSARFSRLWYVKYVHKGQLHYDDVDLHKKYGPVVRLAPGQYSLNDALATKTIYDHASKFIKSDFYAPFGVPDAGGANIFQDQDIHRHGVNRRKIASLYSMTSILSYEPFVDNCMQTYMDQLDTFAQNSRTLAVPRWMQFFAFDVIGAISVGEPYGFLTEGCDFPGIIAELNGGQTYATHLGSFAGTLHVPLAKTLRFLGKKAPFIATQEYTEKSLNKKRRDLEQGKSLKESTGKQDFAEKLFSLMAQNKASEYDLNNSIRANIAAGSDTTGISLSACMYYLLKHPTVLAKLRDEIDTHKSQQSDSTTFLTFAQVQHMPYLQAVIKEALRLHPAVGMTLPRIVPEGGATLAGHFFPAGTVVGVNSWVLHRNPDIFGADCEQFRPERWIDGDENTIKYMDRNLLTFGGGARVCFGKNISLLEIQKLIPELVRRYDFEFVDQDAQCRSLNRFFVYADYDCRVRRRDTVDSCKPE